MSCFPAWRVSWLQGITGLSIDAPNVTFWSIIWSFSQLLGIIIVNDDFVRFFLGKGFSRCSLCASLSWSSVCSSSDGPISGDSNSHPAWSRTKEFMTVHYGSCHRQCRVEILTLLTSFLVLSVQPLYPVLSESLSIADSNATVPVITSGSSNYRVYYKVFSHLLWCMALRLKTVHHFTPTLNVLMYAVLGWDHFIWSSPTPENWIDGKNSINNF